MEYQHSHSSSGQQSANNGRRQLSHLMVFTLFGILGWEEWNKLDDDPLKDKVKWAMLHRKYARYKNAIEVLEEALVEAEKLGNPKIVTRIFDEMANTYYEADELDNAERLFRMVIHRLITIHRKTESSPEFIGISLKLADIFARKGDPESADIGYKHCLSKQLQEADRAMSKYHLDYGANIETKLPVDGIGLDYTEAFALLGMCLHEYALFLMDFYADSRLDEAEEYVLEALKISLKIYGINSFHSLNLLSTFAAKCVLKNKFETARKYLEMGLDRLLIMPECESIIVSYYCCYAEALFHTNECEKAVFYAKKAAEFVKTHPDPAVRDHIKKFAKKMQRDASSRDKGGDVKFSNWFWPF